MCYLTGVGGNLVAVQASRITTFLHMLSRPGRLPKSAVHGCPNPGGAFCGKGTLSSEVCIEEEIFI